MLKVIQITDMHIMPNAGDALLGIATEKYFRKVLEHAEQHHPDTHLMLLTGDIAQTPVETSYQNVFAMLSEVQTPCRCLPGNHDDPALMQKIFNTAQINCNPIFESEHWQFIFLNSQKPKSAGGHLAEEELALLNKQLNLKKEVQTAIFMHHHILPTDSRWMDTMQVENHEHFIELIVPHKQVKTVVCGHIHQEMEKTQDGILYLGTPSSCFQFKPLQVEFALDDKPPGYRVLEFHDDGAIETEVVWLPVSLEELDLNSQGY